MRGPVLCVVLATVLSAQAASAGLSFQTRVDYPAGTGPTAVAVGQLDGDGLPDLLVAGDEGIDVLLGTGAGKFSEPHRIKGTAFLKTIVAADFDGDGHLDVAYPDSTTGAVRIAFGNGHGGFRPDVHSVPVGPRPRALLVAPVNQDDAADLVVAHDDGVSILLGDGHGGFTAAGKIDVRYVPSLATGDFHGRGTLDIVMPEPPLDQVWIAAGDGKGQFKAPTALRAGLKPDAVAVGDLNGDMRPDILVLTSLGAMVLPSTDSGFGPPISFAGPRDLRAAVLGDFDRDGKLDAALIDGFSQSVGVFLGNGDGHFRAGGAYSVGRDPVAVVAEDVNNDNLLDLVAVNHLGDSVTVLLGDGHGNFLGSSTLAAGEDPVAVAAGDFDRDGTLDLAVANENSDSVAVFAGNGHGAFGSGRNYLVGRHPRALVVADFDEDDHPDLAVANSASDSVAVLSGDGRGGFAQPILVSVGAGPGALAVGDFNNDHHLDIAVANSLAKSITVLYGDGQARFPTSTNYAVDLRPTFLLTGDLNRDRRVDLIAGDGHSDKVAILHGTAHGLASAVTGNMGTNVRPLVSDDFNGDGLLDLAVAHESDDEVAILLGTGANSFTEPISFPAGYHPASVAAGDFNRDGKPDLAVVNRGSRTVSILLNTSTKGSRTLAPAPTPTPTAPRDGWADAR